MNGSDSESTDKIKQQPERLIRRLSRVGLYPLAATFAAGILVFLVYLVELTLSYWPYSDEIALVLMISFGIATLVSIVTLLSAGPVGIPRLPFLPRKEDNFENVGRYMNPMATHLCCSAVSAR